MAKSSKAVPVTGASKATPTREGIKGLMARATGTFRDTAYRPKETFTGNICVFASAREVSDDAQDDAYRLGKLIGQNNFNLVYGGFSGGLMGAVAIGALSAGAEVIGITPATKIDPIFDRRNDEIDPYALNSKTIGAGTLENRKRMMLDMSDAVVSLPGGIGTFDELATTFERNRGFSTRGAHSRVALVNTDGFYEGIRYTLDTMNYHGTVNGPAATFAHFAPDVDAAMTYVIGEIDIAKARAANPPIVPERQSPIAPLQKPSQGER